MDVEALRMDSEQAMQGSPPNALRRGDWAAIGLATAVFAGLSLWGAIVSDGFLEADSCTHYLYARFAVGETHYLVNVWGRPVATGLYAVPAALWGRMGVRVTSLLVALALAAVAYRIAKLQGYRRPALAFILVLAQPLVFLHSFSELTELPFALLLALAFWAYCARRWATMAVLAALLPLARPEGFLFVMLAGVALIAHRRWWWFFLLPVPLLLWDYAGWVVYGRPIYNEAWPGGLQWVLWLKRQWPYAQESVYRSGHLLHFVWFLPAIVGPLVFPALLIGVWGSLSKRRDQLLIAVIPLMILGAHSLLYWLGKMASNGELRYMLTVAVFWGLLAAYGWEWIFEKLKWRGAVVTACVVAVLPACANFYWHVVPLQLSQEWHDVRRMAAWYQKDERAKEYPRLLVSHPAFYYFMDISPTDGGRMREWSKTTVSKMPPGTLLVWHEVYALSNSDRERVVSLQEIQQAGWVEDFEAEDVLGDPSWRVFKSARSMAPQ